MFLCCRLSKKVPYFLLGITALLSMNILLLLQQQPNSEGLPLVQTEFLDSRKLRQYVEPSADRTYPVRLPQEGHQTPRVVRVEPEMVTVKPVEALPRVADPVVEEQPAAKPAEPVAVMREVMKADPPTTTVKAATVKSGEPMKPQPTPAKPEAPKKSVDKPVVYGKSPKNTLPPLQSGSYITPNEILQRTAVAIKTFNRAECLLITVASFKDKYPDIPIFVADDSFDDTVSQNLTQEYDVTYIRLPVDSGVGYGRNRLIEHIYKLGKPTHFYLTVALLKLIVISYLFNYMVVCLVPLPPTSITLSKVSYEINVHS